MSFSVHDPASGIEYNGNNLNSLFAQRRNLLSPAFWGMLRDILRFNREALAELASGRLPAGMTLGDYLASRGYGRRFVDHYIVPMGSAIWSMSLEGMLAFPLEFFVRFFKNHGLLSVNDRPQWRVVKGGSRSYIAPLTEPFAEAIRLNCPVQRVERDEGGVTVHSAAGIERFDKIVFACHSDQALALLAEPSAAEREILGALPYADNDVLLHTDTRLLPQRRLAWASWNYRLGAPGDRLAAVTYDMNILQGIDASRTFCVSLNQNDAVDPAQVLGRFRYAHPQYSLTGIAAQARWRELLGARHSYYCGAYWANGFHEDGVVSALRVAAEASGSAVNSAFYSGWVRHRRLRPRPTSSATGSACCTWTWPSRTPVRAVAAARSRAFRAAVVPRAGLPAAPHRPGPAAAGGRAPEPERGAGRGARRAHCLLTQPRCWGRSFNPVSFFDCFDAEERLAAILCEVSNTPWHQRYHYVLPTDGAGSQRFAVAKWFHVSPFLPRELEYHMHYSRPGERLGVHMEDAGRRGQAVRRHPDAAAPDPRPRRRASPPARLPWMSAKTVLGIYWQALRLALKRMPFFSHRAADGHSRVAHLEPRHEES